MISIRKGIVTKEHILAEIRRTALSNSGMPLGKGRFLSETGIKETDWFGRYWSRWGDAVREAGYEPNTLQGAFSDEHLLESIAILTRTLGRFPASGEIRLQRRREVTFPTHNAFRRFGSKAQLVARVRAFCHNHSSLGDVEALCPLPSPPEPSAPRGMDRAPEYGFVYLLKVGKHYKIGKTNAAGRRERELAIQLPERAQTAHVIRTDDPMGIEAYWHKRFESKRKNGEWFELDAADVKAFKRRKFM
jgi:Meiotically up-regulated gene 113